MKILVIGAGKNQRIEGAEHQDQYPFPGIQYIFDLDEAWPIHTMDGFLHRDSYDLVIATHVIEHLKSLVHFMDNTWDLIKEGGTLELETPLAGVNPDLEYSDPTHKRCYREHSFHNYFTLEGIEKFGYTNKPWSFVTSTFRTEVNYDTLKVTGTPIKQQ